MDKNILLIYNEGKKSFLTFINCFIKRLLISTFFVFFIIMAFGQVNYIPYYEKINNAELFYLEQNYISALEQYTDAFQMVPYVYAKDYSNAALICIIIKDFNQAVVYLDSALVRNTNIKWIERLDEFVDFKESNEGKLFFQQLDKVYAKRDQKLDLNQKREFDKVFKRDQRNRNFFNTTFNKKNVLKKDSMNFIKFIMLIKKYGFPCEQELGVDSYVNFLNSIQIIILHNISKYQAKDSLILAMKTEVIRGKLLPESYAWIVDRNLAENNAYYEKYGTFTFYNFDIAKNYFPQCKKTKESIISELDKNRKLIGLEPYKVDLKRKKLMSKNKIILF